MVENSSGHSRLSSVRPGLTSGSVVCMRALASSDAIGDDVSARRPSQIPMIPATTHQPATTGTISESPCVAAPASVTAASALAAPALSRTVIRRKSVNRTVSESIGDQQRQQLLHSLGAVDDDVGLLGDLAWAPRRT